MSCQPAHRRLSAIAGILSILLMPYAALAQQPRPANDEKAHIRALITEARKLLERDTADSLKSALSKTAEATQRAIQTGDKSGEAFSRVVSGAIYLRLDDRPKAIDELHQAAALFNALGDKQNEANSLSTIATIIGRSGQLKQTLDYLEKARALYEAVDNKVEEARVLSRLATVHRSLGDPGTVLKYLTRALALAQAAKHRLAEGRILNSLGSFYSDIANEDAALEHFNRALSIFNEVSASDSDKAVVLHNIAASYFDRNENERARDYYNQSLTLLRSIGYTNGEAQALVGLAGTYNRSEETSLALKHLSQAIVLFRRTGHLYGELQVFNNLGVMYSSRKGDQLKALDCFNQALLITRRIGNKNFEPTILTHMMYAWNRIGNRNLAIFYGKQSINEYQRQRENARTLDPEIQQSFLKSIERRYQRLADILIADGRFAEAQQVLGLLKDQEYFDYVRRDANEIKNLKDRVNLRSEEVELIDRYAALADKVTEIGAQFQALDEKKRALPEGGTLSVDEQTLYEKLSAQLADANAAFRLFLEKDLVKELGRPIKTQIDVDRSLQEKLRLWGDGTVALYTVAGEDRYRVVLTTPSVQVDGKTEIKSEDLNRKVFAFRSVLKNPRVDPRPLAKELYDILIKPIEKDLVAAKAKTLIWSLDGTLRYVPLAALSPDGKSYLVEKYRSVVITSATRQSLSAESEKNWRALGVGVSTAHTVADPSLPGNMLTFAALPGVASELSSIVRDEQSPNETGLLEGRRLIDADFSAKNFADSLSKEISAGKPRYSIVHVASHFRLGDDSANSFLLLGGGRTLTLQQISDSPQMRFGSIELVTLSACDTAFGTGTGKEVDSLATFIELRGAKAIVATLWSVADESTALLMNEFYRLHKSDPELTKAETMQMAQLAMIQGKLKRSGKQTGCRAEQFGAEKDQPEFKCDASAPFAHPFFWSPFVLIGNWR